MKDFLYTLEAILIDMWNYLYVVLNMILNGEVNGDDPDTGDVPPLPMD